MKNRSHSYTDFVHRGRKILVDGRYHQPKVGAVTAVVEDNNLFVGWSLCNFKEGDRFNIEHAISLSQGRAHNQTQFSLTFKKNNPPSTLQLMKSGVPQSCLSSMSRVINKALMEHKQIDTIQIFSNKAERAEPTPQTLWK